jgi:molecular chaperone IbpA
MLDKIYWDLFLSDKGSSFPFYNISKISEYKTLLELAVAGFSKDDLDVSVEGQTLTVRGNKKEEEKEYLVRSISNKNFTRQFQLKSGVSVESVSLENGVLSITVVSTEPNVTKLQITQK